MKILLLLSTVILGVLGTELLNEILEHVNKDCPIFTGKNCPSEDELSFWLFTSPSPSEPYKLELKNLRKAPYVAGPLKIWFHGYTDDHTTPRVHSVRNAYTTHGVYNVLAVDWGYFCKPSCYFHSVQSIPRLGFCIAKFLNTLVRAHKFSQIHFLGHSLGAHLAAWTSIYTNPKVDRLTKFDPAKPFFSEKKTKKGSAVFIETYHSNADLTGQKSPSGHVDIYFNTETFQPGCQCDIGCAHSRCVEYYLETIGRTMKAFHCKGWLHYSNNKCPVPKPKDLITVGEDIDTKRRGIYMAFTNDKEPFLKDHSVYTQPDLYHSFKKVLLEEECTVMEYVSVIRDWVEGKFIRD